MVVGIWHEVVGMLVEWGGGDAPVPGLWGVFGTDGGTVAGVCGLRFHWLVERDVGRG